jgi:hypothetical protein
MRSDHSHDCEGTKDDVRSGVGERSRGQITIATVKGARMTYKLEVEWEGKQSDHSCDCKGSRSDVRSGCGAGEQVVRSQARLR